MKLAIIAITGNGAKLGAKLKQSLPNAELFVLERFAAGEPEAIPFAEPVRDWVARLWDECDGLLMLMATGIVVRTIAPHLRGKAVDPAVVVLDEAGRFAVSLLSGHLGGANQLAREVALLCGGQAVITTATDVNGLPAWDDVARRAGLIPEPLGHIRHLNSLLLEGKAIALVDREERIAPWFRDVPGVIRAANFAAALQTGATGQVFVTHRLIPQLVAQPQLLVLRPRDLVVGIGCNRGTGADEIAAVVSAELRQAFLAESSIAILATIVDKADEEGLNLYAMRKGLPIAHHSAAALNQVPAPTAPSAAVLQAVGAKGVCEPAAILSAGGGPLLVTKKKRGNVTVAVAAMVGRGA